VTDSPTSHDWLGGFAAALLQQVPALHPGMAVHYALLHFEQDGAAQQDPASCAREFAERHRVELARESEARGRAANERTAA
jgi:hypothetical protein